MKPTASAFIPISPVSSKKKRLHSCNLFCMKKKESSGRNRDRNDAFSTSKTRWSQPLSWSKTPPITRVPHSSGSSAVDDDDGKSHSSDERPNTVLPELVAERMLRRMLTFAGVPFLMGVGAFAFFFVLRYRYNTIVLPSFVGYSTLGMFTVGLLGLSYGIMSTSWDAENPGSRLGWTEARNNFLRVYDGIMLARQSDRAESERESSRD